MSTARTEGRRGKRRREDKAKIWPPGSRSANETGWGLWGVFPNVISVEFRNEWTECFNPTYAC